MRRFVPLAAAAVLMAPAGAAALAQAASYGSNVSIGYVRGGPYFDGRVTSSRGACVKRRKVTVYRNTPGADPAIGSDTTSAAGDWRLNLRGRPKSAYYYAKAKSLTVGPAGNRTVCRAAKSVVTRAS